MIADGAIGAGTASSATGATGIDATTRAGSTDGCRWAFGICGALGLRTATGTSRIIGVTHLTSSAEALEATSHVRAFGGGMAGTIVVCRALIDVDASAVLRRVARLAVTDGLMVLGSTRASATLESAARICNKKCVTTCFCDVEGYYFKVSGTTNLPTHLRVCPSHALSAGQSSSFSHSTL